MPARLHRRSAHLTVNAAKDFPGGRVVRRHRIRQSRRREFRDRKVMLPIRRASRACQRPLIHQSQERDEQTVAQTNAPVARASAPRGSATEVLLALLKPHRPATPPATHPSTNRAHWCSAAGMWHCRFCKRALSQGGGLVTNDAFLAGYGAAQTVPWSALHFRRVAGALPFWEPLRKRDGVQRAMAGVNAALVGFLASALYGPGGGRAQSIRGSTLAWPTPRSACWCTRVNHPCWSWPLQRSGWLLVH